MSVSALGIGFLKLCRTELMLLGSVSLMLLSFIAMVGEGAFDSTSETVIRLLGTSILAIGLGKNFNFCVENKCHEEGI